MRMLIITEDCIDEDKDQLKLKSCFFIRIYPGHVKLTG
jgi:hypothetical protein